MPRRGIMGKRFIILAMLISILVEANQCNIDVLHSTLNKYEYFLEQGTYEGQDWSSFPVKPKSRSDTFRLVFEHFVKNDGKTIVELGSTRSFTHGGLEGCNKDNPQYWTPNAPENWDWGAGLFTRMAAECLYHVHPEVHTVDIEFAHLKRCQLITAPYSSIIQYHHASSLNFLRICQFADGIDLIYLDTGNMTPIEETARLQLEEVEIIVERGLLSKHGLLLIDDVKNQTPKLFGDRSGLGKSKYSLPYLLEHGFEIVADEYQVVLRRVS